MNLNRIRKIERLLNDGNRKRTRIFALKYLNCENNNFICNGKMYKTYADFVKENNIRGNDMILTVKKFL